MKDLKLNFNIVKYMILISTFTFGGGYVVIPMIRKYFINKLNLISEEELLDMAAIAQSSPGAIAVNLSVLVGYKTSGKLGGFLAFLGTVIPPLFILSLTSAYYWVFRDNKYISVVLKGMEAGVTAIIVDLIINMTKQILKEKDRFSAILVPAAFVANFVLRINVLIIILSCIIISLIRAFYISRRNI